MLVLEIKTLHHADLNLTNKNSSIALENLVKKSNLHYTRLILFRVLQVSGAHFGGFAPGPTLQGCKR